MPDIFVPFQHITQSERRFAAICTGAETEGDIFRIRAEIDTFFATERQLFSVHDDGLNLQGVRGFRRPQGQRDENQQRHQPGQA
jgi:hypothetical protein